MHVTPIRRNGLHRFKFSKSNVLRGSENTVVYSPKKLAKRVRTSPSPRRIHKKARVAIFSTPTSSVSTVRDVEMRPVQTPTPSSSASGILRARLPYALQIPDEDTKLVDPEILRPIGEPLVDIPIEYQQDLIADGRGLRMLEVLQRSVINKGEGPLGLPLRLELSVQQQPAAHRNLVKDFENTEEIAAEDNNPTHILLILKREPPSSPPRPRQMFLFATHDLPLALYCSSFPKETFDDRPEPTLGSPGISSTFSLPCVPIALPDPLSFPIIQGYMYTRDPRGIMRALVPLRPATLMPLYTWDGRRALDPSLPAPAPTQYFNPSLNFGDRYYPIPVPSEVPTSKSPDQLSAIIARIYNPSLLMLMACRIHGVWANVNSLGIWEQELWDTLNWCWGVVVCALEQVSATRKDVQVEICGSPESSSSTPPPVGLGLGGMQNGPMR